MAGRSGDRIKKVVLNRRQGVRHDLFMRYGGGQRGRGGADRCPVELEQTPRRSCFWVYIRRSLSRRRAWRSSGPAAGPRHQPRAASAPASSGRARGGKEGLSLCLGEFRPQQTDSSPPIRKAWNRGGQRVSSCPAVRWSKASPPDAPGWGTEPADETVLTSYEKRQEPGAGSEIALHAAPGPCDQRPRGFGLCR